MPQTAYVIENETVTNLIVADENTDLAQFNAEFVNDFYPLDVGYKRINGEWFDRENNPVRRFDPLEWKGQLIRQARNEMLAKSDWTQLPDAPVDKEAWAVYRQALRDLTKQPNFPAEIIYPTEP